MGAKTDANYRRILIEEMKSRLQACAILVAVGYGRFDQLFGTFLDAMDRMSDQEPVWKDVDSSLSSFEALLLEYACDTGEMRNHMAVAAHVDGNRSHCLESMTVYGRVAKSDKRTPKRIMDYMKSKQSGGLAIIHHGIYAKVEPGSLFHLQLKDSYHAADHSRGFLNWTRVHGP
jgi:hypothetical protein